MLKEDKLKEVVTEQDDYIYVEEPQDNSYNVIEPFQFIKSSHHPRSSLLVLNQAIEDVDFDRLWNNTELHLCADGGANRLYEYGGSKGDVSKYIPQFITGDLDSLLPEVRQFYETKGTIVIPQMTQYSSDFWKSMCIIILYFHESTKTKLLQGNIDPDNGLSQLLNTIDSDVNHPPINSYILNGLGGRFDQTIHSINQCLLLNKSFPYLKNFFINAYELVFIVSQGKNFIKYDCKSSFATSRVPICGLLPLSGKSIILNTHGLKYDVNNWESNLSGNVSSSNGISSDNGVIIDCSDDLVVNIELNLASQ